MVDDEIREMVMQHTSTGKIKLHATAQGMKTLREDGWNKVRAGQTTIAEVIRVSKEE